MPTKGVSRIVVAPTVALLAVVFISLGWAFVRMVSGNRDSRFLAKWAGGTLLTVPMLPGTAAVLSTILYLTMSADAAALEQTPPNAPVSDTLSGVQVFGIGTGIAVLIWLIVSLVFSRHASVQRGNSGVYAQLLELFDTLAASSVCCSKSQTCDTEIARAEISAHLTAVSQELRLESNQGEAVGSRWISGSGYISVWRRLHRIEEALYVLRSDEAVIDQGLHDELRIRDSTIPNRDELLIALTRALAALRPSVVNYLPVKATRSDSFAGGSPEDASNALRRIRHVVNDFRDDRRDGLVRARSNLLWVMVFTGITAYTLLGLALIRGASHDSIVVMSTFYLVGALAGLFRQLNVASARETVEEDYGLSQARLVHTPLFSGVAAVGGVVLVGMLGTVIPTGGEPSAPTLETLKDIFSLRENAFGLVAAAAFGLAPTTLINRLQAQAEQYKADLSSSEPSGQS